jgi:predicted XRE-type DNA-binding protein
MGQPLILPGGFVITTKNDLLDHSNDTITTKQLKQIIAVLKIEVPKINDITSISISTYGTGKSDPASER